MQQDPRQIEALFHSGAVSLHQLMGAASQPKSLFEISDSAPIKRPGMYCNRAKS